MCLLVARLTPLWGLPYLPARTSRAVLTRPVLALVCACVLRRPDPPRAGVHGDAGPFQDDQDEGRADGEARAADGAPRVGGPRERARWSDVSVDADPALAALAGVLSADCLVDFQTMLLPPAPEYSSLAGPTAPTVPQTGTSDKVEARRVLRGRQWSLHESKREAGKATHRNDCCCHLPLRKRLCCGAVELCIFPPET